MALSRQILNRTSKAVIVVLSVISVEITFQNCSGGFRTIALSNSSNSTVAGSGPPSVSLNQSNTDSPLGTNLAGIAYWSSEMPFLNQFKNNDQWVTHSNSTWDTGEEAYLQLDSDGYPKSLKASSADPNSPQLFNSVGMLLFRSFPNTSKGYYPAGQYVVLYDGEGTITYGFDGQLVSSAPGRDVINVTPSSGGINLVITSTDPNGTGNYIRNIRVVRADREAALASGQIFNPDFLQAIKSFKVLRFMDWLDTNGTQLSSWLNRPMVSNAFWGTVNGAPLEIPVALSNAVGADPWLNVPVMADDNYITMMAKLVHSQLASNLRVYVELSNEVWNSGFSQESYAQNQGLALWPGANPYQANRDWYGMRVAQMCDIWKSVWASDSNRVICVFAAQAANTWTATEALNCPLWTSGAPCSKHSIGVLAIAPYFGANPNWVLPTAWMSQSDGGLGSFFQSMTSQNDSSVPAGGFIGQAIGWVSNYAQVATAANLPLVAYEGGQSFATNSASETALNRFFANANRDARMGSTYLTYLQDWKSNGGTLFMNFSDIGSYSQYGEWGASESLLQISTTSAPSKWTALNNFISTNQCWWANCNQP